MVRLFLTRSRRTQAKKGSAYGEGQFEGTKPTSCLESTNGAKRLGTNLHKAKTNAKRDFGEFHKSFGVNEASSSHEKTNLMEPKRTQTHNGASMMPSPSVDIGLDDSGQWPMSIPGLPGTAAGRGVAVAVSSGGPGSPSSPPRWPSRAADRAPPSPGPAGYPPRCP